MSLSTLKDVVTIIAGIFTILLNMTGLYDWYEGKGKQ